MAKRVHDLCQHIATEYDGQAEHVWTEARDAEDLERRIRALPGFGDMKVKAFGAVLAKRFGVEPAKPLPRATHARRRRLGRGARGIPGGEARLQARPSRGSYEGLIYRLRVGRSCRMGGTHLSRTRQLPRRRADVLENQHGRDIVAGSGISFEERGEHELDGVPGTRRVRGDAVAGRDSMDNARGGHVDFRILGPLEAIDEAGPWS